MSLPRPLVEVVVLVLAALVEASGSRRAPQNSIGSFVLYILQSNVFYFVCTYLYLGTVFGLCLESA